MSYKDREKQLAYMREYNKNYQRKRYDDEKKSVIEKLGGKCAKCGSTDGLEFDHVYRDGKKFSITKKLHSKDLEEEIKKCQLLCHECHLKKTRSDLNQFDYSSFPKNERSKYRSRIYYWRHKDEINQKRRDRRKTQNALQKRPTGGST